MCGISPGFPKILSKFPTHLSKYSSLKFYLGRPITQNEIISFAFERALYGLSFDILDPYMQLIVCLGFSFGKLCKNMEKLLFFRGATDGLGKYHTNSSGRIGVYRLNCTCNLSLSKNGLFLPTWKLLNFSGFQVHVHGKLQEEIPGQVQNYQTFQLSLYAVKSLKQVKHTGTTLGIF